MATTTPTITRYRGDTVADQFILVDGNNVAIDITTGFSFRLTVNSEQNPVDASNQLYSLVGAITNGPAGAYEFSPSALQADQAPATYFYDVEVTDPSGKIKTVEKGKYIYKQDIGK